MNDIKNFNLSKDRNKLWKNICKVDENINKNIPYNYIIFAYNVDIKIEKLIKSVNSMLNKLLYNIDNNGNKYQDDMIIYYLDIDGDIEIVKKNINDLFITI